MQCPLRSTAAQFEACRIWDRWAVSICTLEGLGSNIVAFWTEPAKQGALRKLMSCRCWSVRRQSAASCCLLQDLHGALSHRLLHLRPGNLPTSPAPGSPQVSSFHLHRKRCKAAVGNRPCGSDSHSSQEWGRLGGRTAGVRSRVAPCPSHSSPSRQKVSSTRCRAECTMHQHAKKHVR